MYWRGNDLGVYYTHEKGKQSLFRKQKGIYLGKDRYKNKIVQKKTQYIQYMTTEQLDSKSFYNYCYLKRIFNNSDGKDEMKRNVYDSRGSRWELNVYQHRNQSRQK